jgi:hypothetical protein
VRVVLLQIKGDSALSWRLTTSNTDVKYVFMSKAQIDTHGMPVVRRPHTSRAAIVVPND